MDERQAIKRLRQGDINGLEELVRRYELPAVRTAYLITRDYPLAEDVVQTAFVRAYERIDQFDPQRPFGPWFLQGIVHDALKAATRQARHVPLGGPGEGDELAHIDRLVNLDPSAEELVEQAETREAVQAALAQLSPHQRAAIVQRYYLGLSEADMARAQHCPPGTIKWRLHAARARLRVLLQALSIARRSTHE